MAATIVRFNPGDYTTDKHGVYEYVVDYSTGQPFTFDVSAETFPCGTLVRHVSMDLGKHNKLLTAPVHSLYYLAHHYLFDPVFPFRIEESRENSSKGEHRAVGGNHRLLTLGEHTEYQREAIQTFRNGSVKITWWVLSAEGDSARDRITQYCMPSKPIVITYNGQKQGDLPNTVIKNDLKLPYLERYLVVHVDCDHLDNESRRQLFPTTRESLRDTSLLEELRQLVKETLEADDTLQQLDRERKQRYIQRGDSQSIEHVRQRLASRVKAVIMTGGRGSSPRVGPPEPTRERPEQPPIPVQEPPTMLDIASPNPRHVYAGRRFTIRFRTDADPSYFFSPDSFLAIIDPPSFGQYTGTTNVHDGYGTGYFLAKEDNPVGSTAQIALELRPRKSKALSSSIAAEIVALPSDTGTGQGNAPTPNINPQWVSEGDSFWNDFGWDQDSVARVVRTEDSIDVFVSRDNRKLNQLILRAQRRDSESAGALLSFYLEHISFYAVLADISGAKLSEENGDGGGELPDVVLERMRELEHQRMCETLCGIMDDLLALILTGASVAGGTDR